MKKALLRSSVVPAMVAALALAGCSGSSDGSDSDGSAASGTLAANWGGFPESWAPGAEMEAGYMRVPYETLVALGEGGEIEPVLATEWEQTDDALTLTLREGVTFHDGTPFDGEAVKANIEAIQGSQGPYSAPLQVVESVEVVDDQTVTLNLASPTPSLLTFLSTRGAPMASPEAIADGSVATDPVGTGPWAYDESASSSGTQMSFTAYDDYWGEDVGFDTIELYAIEDDNAAAAALASGEIDLGDSETYVQSQFEGRDNIETLSYPAIRNNLQFFDRGPGGVFEDVDVRRAACYAIDQQVVADLAGDMVSATQHFAEGEPGYNDQIDGYPVDTDEANSLMQQAGNPSVSAEILATVFNEDQIQVYADQMGEAGMDVSVQSAPPPQYFSEWNSGRYPMGLGSNDELTPYDWYRAWFAADAPGNPSGVESDELKAAADAAIAAGASEEADALWADVTKVIADEALACGHMVGEELIAWNADVVTGVAPSSQPWEPNLVDYQALQPAGGGS
ncbi:peptide/nickel transport system substrate-binding protein [Mumia flava]|uniref:Peptide/nickel transport system substrate-binding protein n=1 Tax=Mumia flava TaxID=1348852 RepID=A0A0B2BAI6_9ACTN|nr:ABC transporter substrate-binding protein [Mumia flava]PJJ48251.1 peptide/nickel transport system substrate-binding protein [Mumia flava]